MDKLQQLEIEDFAMNSLRIEPNLQAADDAPSSVLPKVEFNAYLHQTDATRFMVTLGIQSPELCEFNFSAQVSGYFKVSEPFLEGHLSTQRVVNGLTILYGIARAHVATATSWFGAPVQLATVYFTDLVREKAEKTKAISDAKKPVLKKPAVSG